MGNKNYATLDFFVAESSVNRMLRQRRLQNSLNSLTDQIEARQCNICKQSFLPESRQQRSCGKCTTDDASFVAVEGISPAVPTNLIAARQTRLALVAAWAPTYL